MDYDIWKTTNPDWKTEPDPEELGYVKVDDLPDFDMTTDYLYGCMEALYMDGDIEKLERCLEELCGQFKVNYSKRTLKIENKEKNRLLHWQLGYQRATQDLAKEKKDGY